MNFSELADPRSAVSVGARLRQLRLRGGLSTYDLATQIGVSRASISLWENGKRVPRLAKLNRLATVLSTSVAYLIAGSSENRAQGEVAQTGPSPSVLNSADVVLQARTDIAAALNIDLAKVIISITGDD